MTKKPNDYYSSGEENKEGSGKKLALSKYEYDLYHEEDDIAEPVLRVKRFSLPNKAERWKFFENTKVTFILEGAKLTIKEKEFLRSVDGINFLLTSYKQGLDSINLFKKELKKQLK